MSERDRWPLLSLNTTIYIILTLLDLNPAALDPVPGQRDGDGGRRRLLQGPQPHHCRLKC